MERAPHPSLGLVMQLAALFVLPHQLSLLVLMAASGGMSFELAGVAFTVVVLLGMQLVVGSSIARRVPATTSGLLIWAYPIVAVVATAVIAITMVRDGVSPLQVIALVIETLGGPAIVLAAPAISGGGSIDRNANTRPDVAAALTVLGVAKIITTIFYAIDTTHLMTRGTTTPGAWLASGIMVAFSLGVAALELYAASRLRTGSVSAARRAFLTYVLIVGCGNLIYSLTVIAIRAITVGTEHRMAVAQLMVLPVISMLAAIAVPLVIWAYVSADLRDDRVVIERDPPRVPAWAALWFVPLLFARTMHVGAIGPDYGVALKVVLFALFVTLGATTLIAAFAALRDRPSASLYAAIAAVLAFGLLAIGIVVLYVFEPHVPVKPIWPIVVLVALLAALAWTRRRTSA